MKKQSVFMKNYTNYQKESIYLSNWENNKNKFIPLINEFKSLDLKDFLDSLNKFELTKDSMKIHNFLDIINDKWFIKNLTKKEKKEIVDKIEDILIGDINNLNNYKLLWYWLSVLIWEYSQYAKLATIKKIYKYSESKKSSYLFRRYFLKKQQPKLHLDALLNEFKNKDEDWFSSINISSDDIDYLANNWLFKELLLFLKDNTNSSIKLFDQLWRDISAYKRVKKSFINAVSKSNDYLLLSENIIKNVIKLFYRMDDYWKKDFKVMRRDIEKALKSDFFLELVYIVSQKNPDFPIKIFDTMKDWDFHIYWHIYEFCVYWMNEKNMQKILNHSLIKWWDKLNIFYVLKRSNREDKTSLLKLYKSDSAVKKIIKENEKAIKEQEKKDRERLEKENKEKRNEIEIICDMLKKDKNLFSEKLLYMYEETPDIFLEDEIAVIKEQIDYILTDNWVLNPKKNWEVRYSKDKENQFTWPSFMANWTIERCIDIWEKLGIDLFKYSKRFIDYLPYSFSTDKLLKYIKQLDKEDIEYLLSVYDKNSNRKDDLRLFHPWVFVEIVKKDIKLFNEEFSNRTFSILKDLLDEDNNDRISFNLRWDIIVCLWNFAEEEFFTKRFNKYINNRNLNYFNDILNWSSGDITKKENFKLGIISNKILIERFKNNKAIQRRLKQLENINVKVERPLSGRPFWLWWLLGEVWFGEKEFLKPLYSIEYPEFKEEVIDILKKSFELEQEDNLVIWYLQEFVVKYLKPIEDQELIELKESLKLLTNSDDFFNWYYPKLFENKTGLEIENIQLKTENYNLKEENKELKNELKETKEYITKFWLKNILFVEWYTDKVYIEKAYRELYPQKDMPFQIINWGWIRSLSPIISDYLKEIAYNESFDINIFVLVDWDFEWVKLWKRESLDRYMDWDKNLLEKWSENVQSDLYTAYNESKTVHLILLPVIDIFKHLIIKPLNHSIEKNSVVSTDDSAILNNTYWKQCSYTIEYLLYFDWIDINTWNGVKYFWNRYLPWWVKSIWFIWTDDQKVQMANYINNNDIVKISVRERFKTLFEYIDNNI